jgi:hypothetical protein
VPLVVHPRAHAEGLVRDCNQFRKVHGRQDDQGSMLRYFQYFRGGKMGDNVGDSDRKCSSYLHMYLCAKKK